MTFKKRSFGTAEIDYWKNLRFFTFFPFFGSSITRESKDISRLEKKTKSRALRLVPFWRQFAAVHAGRIRTSGLAVYLLGW